MSTTTTFNSWIKRKLNKSYTIQALNRPVMTRASTRYEFNVHSWAARIALNDQECTLDFYQVGRYHQSDYHTVTKDEYLDFESEEYQSLAAKQDFIEFYSEINQVIVGFNLPLDILDPSAYTKYELVNVKGYSASIGGIQAQLNSHKNSTDAQTIREKWMPGRTHILERYYAQQREKEGKDD